MRLNPVMERFYLGTLSYAGLELKDDVIVNKSEKLGKYTIDDKDISLPYMDLLKNPEGKAFFHPLNENYASPENTLFNMYKNRLVLELNLRLTTLITSLITVASDVQIQKRVRSSGLMEIIANIGEPDHSVIEAFLGMVKASSKQNKESFLVDIYLKKNGEINDTPYAAIGKLNFRLAEEIERSLNAPEKDYKVFGSKFRKKDLMIVGDIFAAIFKFSETQNYIVGTDNKVFRYLNVLLKTAYMLSERINEIGKLLEELNEVQLNVEEMFSPHDWIEPLSELQGMATEIRLIPSQVNLSTEAKHLMLDESKAVAPAQVQTPTQTKFDPGMVQQTQPIQTTQQPQPVPQQPMQPQQPRQLTPEEIIRGSMGAPGAMQPMMQPGMMPQQMMMQPGMMTPQQMMMMNTGMMPGVVQQQPIPSWIQAENMKAQMAQMPQQQMMQQPMMQPGMMPQQMMMQPGMMTPQQMMMMQTMMQNQQPQPGQIAINPLFQNNTQLPWN